MRLPHLIILAVCILSLGAPFACPAQPATNLWRFILPEDYGASLSLAIATDGTIYLTTFRGFLVALTPDGHFKWKFKGRTRNQILARHRG